MSTSELPEGDYLAHLERSGHLARVQEAVRSGREGDWHDFKAGLFVDGEAEKLCKDVVALANTPGGPYQGYGYIIIGVTDQGVNTGLVGSEARMTLDDRVQQVKNRVQSGIDPYVPCEVLELTVDGQRLHVVAVPHSQGSWHLVRTPADQSGPWVRRGWSSERPTLSDYTAHQLRLVQLSTAPLRDEVDRLKVMVQAQREQLADLRAAVQPDDLPAREQVRVHFATPELALRRAVRGELATYLHAQDRLYRVFNDLNVDHVLSHSALQTPERLDHLRAYLEDVEATTRPVTHLASAILHETDQSPAAREVLVELADAVASTCTFSFPQVPFQDALKTYSGQLLMHGLSLSVRHAQRWAAYFDVVWHLHRYPGWNGTQYHQLSLGLLLGRRHALDQVIALVEPHVNRRRATYHRLSRLLPELTWVGEQLPPLHRGGTMSDAEFILMVAYLSCVSRWKLARSAPLDLVWWTYLNANQIAVDNFELLLKWAADLIGPSWLRALAIGADELEKPETKLTVSLTGLVEERVGSWSE